ncbi:Y-family DNA polymerase [Adlercreutzia shanghongiae]|uniref:DNA repair protein n=1 Tax=Adlercreutzia shanghongiae TaxID=3111773 RepID=A0ABU6IXA4_9ACTN|nr:DNA repair protein [Adlercreutzia sp. R22]MEC4294491.1 DNA repair protein [Adlercreutzia sp. R22]
MECERTYVCIDLKSFYASVECVARGLDPMEAMLVVADPTRSEMTICLAVSPAMKAAGVRNRCRLYEIPSGMEFITAKPRMKKYMEASAEIYATYLRYVSPEDIHPYSIDECFIDATPYLELYDLTAREFADTLRAAVKAETGIPATVGIGPNLFLAKVALDISAKHAPDGVGELGERSFREQIWRHRPITDIWNIGPGIARRLAKYRVFDLAGVTEMDPDVLYDEFGVNAEYLIDHAWGVEPCTIAEIKAYEPETTSLMNGQILPCGYNFDDTLMVMREMTDDLVLDLVGKRLVTDHISLHVSYARSQDEREEAGEAFEGGHGTRRIGGSHPHGGGSRKIPERTNSFAKLYGYLEALYRETVDPARTMRKISIGFGNLVDEDLASVDLFTDVAAAEREHRRQKAVLAVKEKFGKNALIKGVSLKEHALGRERNEMVGGHHG